MNASSDSNGGTGKHKRRSLAVDSLLREASQFLKGAQPDGDEAATCSTQNNDTPMDSQQSQQPSEGLRRSTRRLTQACKNSCQTTPMRTFYHAIPNSDGSHGFNICDDSVIQTSSPRDEFVRDDNLLEVEMESLQIKTRPRRAARRKASSKFSKKTSPDDNSYQEDSAQVDCMEATFSGTFIAVCESTSAVHLTSSSSSSNQDMEVEDGDVVGVDPEVVAFYTNQKFVKPENTGLETIDEITEEVVEIEASPIKSKRPRAAPKKKTVKTKQPWRFIPHLVVNPPEIWWQEMPFKKQAECRKKAREAGYRPATKKRLLDAERKVQLKLDELDRYTKSEDQAALVVDNTLHNYQEKSPPADAAESSSLKLSTSESPSEGSLSQSNESTFNSLQVFVGDSASSSPVSPS